MSHICNQWQTAVGWGAYPEGATIQQMLMPEQVASDDGFVLIRLMSPENRVVIAT